jgi:hypothetical protein
MSGKSLTVIMLKHAWGSCYARQVVDSHNVDKRYRALFVSIQSRKSGLCVFSCKAVSQSLRIKSEEALHALFESIKHMSNSKFDHVFGIECLKRSLPVNRVDVAAKWFANYWPNAAFALKYI